MRVAILRCENLPAFVEGDIADYDELFDDDRLLIAAFEAKGFKASLIVWTDPATDWSDYDIAIVRSTWDYIDRREEFLNVLSRIEASSCKLFNPLEVIRWNSNKNYMLDLEKWKVPIVPTYKADGTDLKALQNSFAEKNWLEAVLKPAVGAGGADVHRTRSNEILNKYKKLKLKQSHHNFIIQPLIDSVMTEGEWSYVYVNGELSHVLLKKPAAGDYRTNVVYGGSIISVQPQKNDLRYVDSILTKIPFDLLYARLDLVRVGDELAVMELELIEPVLYFNLARKGIEQMVNAAISKLKETN